MVFRYKHSVLGTYEIENVSGSYLREVGNDFAFVDTSICYNNDYFLGDTILKNDHIKVISKIPPQMTDQYEFMMSNHLRCLGRKKIDIMLIHNPRADWSRLAKIMKKDERIVKTGVSNFSIDDLVKYKKLIGHYPYYNEMEINPNYYDKELIEFCHENGIEIIAYAILGGKYNARRNISQYTLPYLLMLAAKNAEYVIVRSDSYTRVASMKIFMDRYLESVKVNESLFNLKQTTDKSIIPDQYKFPEVFSRAIFPTNSDRALTGPDFTLSRGFSYNPDDVQDDINLKSMIESKKYEFISDYRVLARYLIDGLLKEETGRYPDICSYIYPSMYTAGYKKNFWSKVIKKKYPYIISAVNILTKDSRLNKIKGEEDKFIVESIKKYI